MKSLLKFVLDMVTLSLRLYKIYKASGYEVAHQRILKVVSEKNDKKTAKLVSDIVNDKL